MTTYILLRDNRESAPLSLDQLRELGLRPNDLVWVEGQSASWRNPHEIRELKELSQAQAQSATITEKKSVFVAMPEKQAVAEKPKTNVPVISDTPSYSSFEVREAEKPKEEMETKFSMSMDEIKERYVKSLENRNKKPGPLSFKFKIPPQLKMAAVYIGLIGLGAIIVYLIMKAGSPVSPVANVQNRLPGTLETRPVTDSAITAETTDEDEIVYPESYFDSQASSASVNEKEQPVKRNQQTITAKPAQKENSSITISENSSKPKEEKISNPESEEQEARTIPVSEIAEKVSVKTNSYTIAALGGIRNLELTLRNDSRYTLDKVTVEVRFLSPNGNIVKSEDVHFKSIRPGASQTIGMKKTTRGVKVEYKIIGIESKEVGTHTAGL